MHVHVNRHEVGSGWPIIRMDIPTRIICGYQKAFHGHRLRMSSYMGPTRVLFCCQIFMDTQGQTFLLM